MPLSISTIIAFTALTLALASLWLSSLLPSPIAARAWIVPGMVAVVFGVGGGLVDLRGVDILLSFAIACTFARRTVNVAGSVVSHAIMLVIGVGLFVHVLPGFDNPRTLNAVILSADAVPYTKYLNFDKGMAALLLLGLYAPDRVKGDEGARHVGGFVWRCAVVIAIVMAASLAVGYVRWDAKLPTWWASWLWSMVFLTALPEEAAFRGVWQTGIERRFGDTPRAAAIAAVVAGITFGVAHIAGGPVYVLLASLAGIGYGWVYASTRSLAAAIATHAGLNTIHFLCFTYPALAVAAPH